MARQLRRESAGSARLIGRRLRTPRGEVDLVFATSTELVCVEVKTGRLRSPASAPSDLYRPARNFDQRRYLRQARAAALLARSLPPPAAHGPGPDLRPRVDLVEVLVVDLYKRVRLTHHPRMRAGFGGRP